MADDLRNADTLKHATLSILSDREHISPSVPAKRIHDGGDLSHFLRTRAYADIMTFLLQLNRAMVPEQSPNTDEPPRTWPIGCEAVELSPSVRKIAQLVQSLKVLMDDAPPETGPRRFGNAAFRTWYAAAERAVPGLLREHLSSTVWDHVTDGEERHTLEEELGSYLLGSFGSSERLDYGTGHELSFLAFLACVWKLGGFAHAAPGVEERGIVLGVVHPYLELIRSLILTYTLEPAGSHGVWGLDDHFFLPYIFGSAQFCPPIQPGSSLPTVGSLNTAPSPDRAAKRDSVDHYRSTNLYFSAIGFIFDVKSGPFWEHSPTLYDISGIKDGWAKINKGMVKMYNAEVLSKFPVVQHFPFGTLFSWEVHPLAGAPAPSPHISAQPQSATVMAEGGIRPPRTPGSDAPAQTAAGTAAPWARPTTNNPSTSHPSRSGALPGRLPLNLSTVLPAGLHGTDHTRPTQPSDRRPPR